jgi:hypothetical protein
MDEPEHEQPEDPPQVDRLRVLWVLRFEALQLDGEADGEQHAEHAVELAREQHIPHGLSTAVPPLGKEVRSVHAGKE